METAQGAPAVRLEHLGKRYGRLTAELLPPERTFLRGRLAYRDVASASNRLTLIAAIVPAGTVYGLLGHNGAGKTTLVNQGHRSAQADRGEDRDRRS